jgi:hypothetical protein
MLLVKNIAIILMKPPPTLHVVPMRVVVDDILDCYVSKGVLLTSIAGPGQPLNRN